MMNSILISLFHYNSDDIKNMFEIKKSKVVSLNSLSFYLFTVREDR